MRLGETIKHHRKEKEWTLKDLSAKCGLSVGQLSKLENDKSSASIGALRKIAEAFDIPVSALPLTETQQRLHPVLDGEGFVMRWRNDGEKAVTVRYLTLSRQAKMQPIIITIPPQMDTGASQSHPGDEFFYVLEGTVRFFYHNESFDLRKGDFLYYDGLYPHHWHNLSETEEAKVMTCNDPPVM